MSFNNSAFGKAMNQLWRETFSKNVSPDSPSISVKNKMKGEDLQTQLNKAALRNRDLCNEITSLTIKLSTAVTALKEIEHPAATRALAIIEERKTVPIKNPDSADAEIPKKTETRKRRSKSTHKPLF